MLELVRLVRADDWELERAGVRLRELVPDPWAFRELDHRVRRALAERPCDITQRAADTVACALDDLTAGMNWEGRP